MTILSIGCKPNNFKSPKSLKLSFTNIQGLHSNFAEYESFPLTFLLLCEIILDDWSDSGNFSVRGHLPLFNPKGFCYSYSQTCSFMKEGFPFAENLSLQKSADSYLCFQLALLHSVPCFWIQSHNSRETNRYNFKGLLAKCMFSCTRSFTKCDEVNIIPANFTCQGFIRYE